jgi:hypothetical protein
MRTRRPVSRVLCPPPLSGGDGHSSGPPIAGRFSRPTRVPEGPATAPSVRGRTIGTPIRSCSRRGLPCRPRRRVRGGLLPHPFTLTRLRSYELRRGGLLSVALSLGSPPAGVTRRLVAVEPGLSSPKPEGSRAAARPSGPPAKVGPPQTRVKRQAAASLRRAMRRARVSPSAPPSASQGRQCIWKAVTTVAVQAS